jgi:hypothetical protein
MCRVWGHTAFYALNRCVALLGGEAHRLSHLLTHDKGIAGAAGMPQWTRPTASSLPCMSQCPNRCVTRHTARKKRSIGEMSGPRGQLGRVSAPGLFDIGLELRCLLIRTIADRETGFEVRFSAQARWAGVRETGSHCRAAVPARQLRHAGVAGAPPGEKVPEGRTRGRFAVGHGRSPRPDMVASREECQDDPQPSDNPPQPMLPGLGQAEGGWSHIPDGRPPGTGAVTSGLVAGFRRAATRPSGIVKSGSVSGWQSGRSAPA